MHRVVPIVQNNSASPHTYWIEPWAHDFTLMPAETFELRICAAVEPLVEFTKGTTDTQICLKDEHWSVVQNGLELSVGHNRHLIHVMSSKENS